MKTKKRFPEMRDGVRRALEPGALAYFEGRETAPYNLSTLIAALTENGSIEIGTSPAIDEHVTDRLYPAIYYRVVELFGVKPDSRDATMLWDCFRSGHVLSGHESNWICSLYSAGRQLDIKQQWKAVFSRSISEQIIATFGVNNDRLTQMVDDQKQLMNSRRDTGKYINFAGGSSLSRNEQYDIAYLETLRLSKYTVTVGNLLEVVHKDLCELGEIVVGGDDEEEQSGFAEDVLDSILCDLRGYDLVWSDSIDDLLDPTTEHNREQLEGLVTEVDVEQIIGNAYAQAYATTPDGQRELDIPNPFRKQLFFSEEQIKEYKVAYPSLITRSQHVAWEASQPRN